MPDTLFTLTGLGLPPYAARGLREKIEPIAESSKPRRTVNAALKNTAASQMEKYRIVVTCEDFETPSLNGLYPGRLVTVGLTTEFSFLTATESAARPIVTGSTRTDGAFTFYRPLLNCMVISFNSDFQEYEARYSWELDLEEV